jgi:hypothetical protein
MQARLKAIKEKMNNDEEFEAEYKDKSDEIDEIQKNANVAFSNLSS